MIYTNTLYNLEFPVAQLNDKINVNFFVVA